MLFHEFDDSKMGGDGADDEVSSTFDKTFSGVSSTFIEISSTFIEISSTFDRVSSTFAVLFTSGLSKNKGDSFVSFNGTESDIIL